MGSGGFLKPYIGGFIMKKSLLLALAFAAICGYVMADEDTTTPATPATEDETTQAQPAAEPQEDEALDMDAMLDETEEAK
jgi:hypothetical protein